MNFYNTTHETGQTLIDFEKKATKQEDRILLIFKGWHQATPMKIERLTGYPRSSIARALSNLTKEGKIIKTDQTATSKYGRPEHIWKLA